jgi:hypothetical protein
MACQHDLEAANSAIRVGDDLHRIALDPGKQGETQLGRHGDYFRRPPTLRSKKRSARPPLQAGSGYPGRILLHVAAALRIDLKRGCCLC